MVLGPGPGLELGWFPERAKVWTVCKADSVYRLKQGEGVEVERNTERGRDGDGG